MVINLWAVLCLAFMASYTANLGEQLKVKLNNLKMKDLNIFLLKTAAFMIIQEEYPNLKGVLDKRVRQLTFMEA